MPRDDKTSPLQFEGVRVDDVVEYHLAGRKPRRGRVLEVTSGPVMRHSRRSGSFWSDVERALVNWFRAPGHHGWQKSRIDTANLTVISRRPEVPALRSDEV